MSLLIFKFFLPILLGYTLFVGLSGRFVPFSKPAQLSERPSWFLGLWTGASVALVTGIAMHMAMQIPIDKIVTLAKPTGLLLAALLVVGSFGYLIYRKDVADELRYQNSLNQSAEEMITASFLDIEQVDQTDLEFDSTMDVDFVEESQRADQIVEHNDLAPEIDHSEATEEVVNSGDFGSVSLLFDQVSTPALSLEEPVSSAAKLTGTPTVSSDTVSSELAEKQSELSEMQSVLTDKQVELNDAQSELTDKTSKLTETQSELTDERSKLTETQSVLTDQQTALDKKHSDNVELTVLVEQLSQRLTSEAKMRSQSETHLRITRKALKNLEGDARNFEINKANAIIAVEVQLESHVRQTASSKARANREETKRVEAHEKIVTLTQDLLQSKRELRQNTEARARALSTANKSVAFARKNVQARSRAEARVKLLESRLKLSQQALKSRNASLSSDSRFKQEVSSRIKSKLIRHRENIDG